MVQATHRISITILLYLVVQCLLVSLENSCGLVPKDVADAVARLKTEVGSVNKFTQALQTRNLGQQRKAFAAKAAICSEHIQSDARAYLAQHQSANQKTSNSAIILTQIEGLIKQITDDFGAIAAGGLTPTQFQEHLNHIIATRHSVKPLNSQLIVNAGAKA